MKGGYMAQKGYEALTVREGTTERVKNLNVAFEPNMSRGGFIVEVIDFYERNHCPECGECIAKKEKHHVC